jgi:hypothetical protein
MRTGHSRHVHGSPDSPLATSSATVDHLARQLSVADLECGTESVLAVQHLADGVDEHVGSAAARHVVDDPKPLSIVEVRFVFIDHSMPLPY